ncbi:MAG: putative sulfate/molybdate transporter [Desulfopila sp.]
MQKGFLFNRMEIAGSFGDLGTILPLAVGMIMINGLNPVGVFCGVGLFYIFSGLYFRVTCPVEPMKVMSGYAIATGIGSGQIHAACLWLFVFLLIIGVSGMIDLIRRYTATSVIRGVQLSTGLLLISQGVKLIAGTSPYQQLQAMAEPYLRYQQIGGVPIGLLLGAGFGFLALFFLDNRRLPAALLLVGFGAGVGLVLGTQLNWEGLRPGLYLPELLPGGWPTMDELGFVLLLLVLPQVPMTIGNAVIANADLSHQYFPEAARRVTYSALCISMALANLVSFLIGGIPMCHGAGGLASRYRFGARTGGSNLVIGALFLLVALLLGRDALVVINLLPLAVLGVLLVFSGSQLALTILDVRGRKELFVVVLVVGVTIASNLAVGFVVGMVVAALLRWDRLSV